MAERLQLDGLKQSVLQGLSSTAVQNALKAAIGSDAVQEDLGSLSPATLVQVLHATLSGPASSARSCTCALPLVAWVHQDGFDKEQCQACGKYVIR
jgi:hypothetical protein